MSRTLTISIRMLDSRYHGRGDGGEPEWPPSPLRMFQALVAAAAARWNERARLEYAAPALEWLARQPAPAVVAAVGVASGVKYRLYVPDNVGDQVAKSWRGGNTNASIAEYRTEKDVRPTHLTGDAVHYLYPLADGDPGFAAHQEVLRAAARSVTHLGWGVDMVAGDARELSDAEAADLAGERWRPTDGAASVQLRAPRDGTLEALMGKHKAFLERLSGDGFRPVPPLTAFDTVGYRRESDPDGRAWAAFRIHAPDPDAPTPSFDAPRRCADVAAWTRHAVGEVCRDWPDVAAFVHGHAPAGGPLKGAAADQRFMYLPLPTLNPKLNRVEAIRRVLVAAPPGCADRVEWVRRRLPGRELEWDGQTREVHGVLGDLPGSDWVLGQYVGVSAVWSTVTPVVWPGYDDGDPGKAERLLRKAFVDAGLPPALVAGIAELAWRNVGFRPGADLASRYVLPSSWVQRKPVRKSNRGGLGVAVCAALAADGASLSRAGAVRAVDPRPVGGRGRAVPRSGRVRDRGELIRRRSPARHPRDLARVEFVVDIGPCCRDVEPRLVFPDTLARLRWTATCLDWRLIRYEWIGDEIGGAELFDRRSLVTWQFQPEAGT